MDGISYTCGHCEHVVNTSPRYVNTNPTGAIEYVNVCPRCGQATLRDRSGRDYPAAPVAGLVQHLPPEVDSAWKEVRLAYASGALTASEMMCRKILMHLAVGVAGSQPGKQFVTYVDDLDAAGYIAPGLKDKVSEIRKRGNVANHDLPASSQADAEKTIQVTKYLLQSVYELPNS